MLELSQLQAGAPLKFRGHLRSIWGMIRAQAAGAGALSEFLPCVMAGSTLVWDMAGARGLATVLSSGCTFSPGSHTLVGSWIGAGGIGTHH